MAAEKHTPSMICLFGGLPIARHNEIRDMTARSETSGGGGGGGDKSDWQGKGHSCMAKCPQID